MSGWRNIPVGELVEPVVSWNPLRASQDEEFDYIDLSAVDQNTKTILAPRKVACGEAPSRARQLVAANDVLVSTVRPNLNGVASVPAELDQATASTGFCVLRPRSNKLGSSYLFHWVKSPRFVSDMVKKATGASYPAVSDKIIFESLIPVPPLPEQIRIAAILDQADALRVKRREALAQLDSLTQSIFVEMFGDPASNFMGWTVTPLETVATKITDGEHQTPKRTEFGIKLLSARNIRDGYLDFGDVDFIDDAEHQKISKRCNPERGDILISCSGSIGRVAIVETDEPLGLVRSAALVKPNHQKILSKYLETFLRTPHMNRMMINKAHSSSQANLFQGPIRALPIVLPPISLQQEFVEKSDALQTLRNLHNAANSELENLFASLQHRAFRGEL